ncbi:hypothetical protein [Mesorhizobium xinjiangense]|uniref:hypothetical protein n=1 Tax=Mesorhizobium xinjiangense TaxID=2678685 RepID=UPI0012ED9E33|nr:hypothetical protein [Mesorhizobium xinjiangense]
MNPHGTFNGQKHIPAQRKNVYVGEKVDNSTHQIGGTKRHGVRAAGAVLNARWQQDCGVEVGRFMFRVGAFDGLVQFRGDPTHDQGSNTARPWILPSRRRW